ncbi:MAG: ACR3 family arsenite efflux transporter [Candidatus Kariarchaeaceae archaeon]|jgi:ACR3 family arsenite transporter
MGQNVENSQKTVIGKLSIIDRFLPVWIIVAMVIGFGLSYVDFIVDLFEKYQILDTTSIPIAIGLLWMMYPVLAKVKYEEIDKVFKEGKMFGTSLFLNWVIGPILMFVLAFAFLYDEPEFREGIIMVGLARCIAMVLIWNMLAGGDNEDAAVLVALNSLFQVVAYSFYAYFFLTIASPWFGGEKSEIDISMGDIALSVFIFLGIPLIAGIITRIIGLKKIGKERYDTEFAPKLGPTALIGLLFTIVVMFSMQGKQIVDLKGKLLLVAAPLVFYFFIMFGVSFLLSWVLKFTYSRTVTLSFTAASNNFELAIAVAIGTYGIESNQAVSTVIGPLIEVPVLIFLVYVSLWAKQFFFTSEGNPKQFKQLET